jgi:hypothetical protein
VRAQQDVPSPSPGSAEVKVEDASAAEVARMTAVLDGQYKNAKIWYWTWTAGYGAISIVETVINATATGDARTAAQVGIVTSTFGFFATAIFPPPVAFDWEPIQKMPEDTPEQRAVKAAATRHLFQREVQREAFRHSVWGHLIGLVFDAGISAYMYWGLHLGGRAALNFLISAGLWEANLWTSPNASLQLEEELKAGPAVPVSVVPVTFGTTGAGVAVVGRF